MDFFKDQIHLWYSLYKRDLPWRNNQNPYLVWLSEIILQQTRIDQGTAYFLKFRSEFPNLKALATASEDQILKLWQGLGYYSRARNLHFTAKFILEKYQGEFPSDYKSIRALKGIGDYTAAAISSICFNLEYATVDGNVYRILSRFFGIEEPIDTNKGKKVFEKLANELIKNTNPGIHNQALMEFGSLQCKPKNPDCKQCPVKSRCFAFSNNKIDVLPLKNNKTKIRDRYFNYIILLQDKNTWLRKRISNDIWKNLYEFPILETNMKTEMNLLPINDLVKNYQKEIQIEVEAVSNWETHILSHQKIHHRFIEINITDEFELPDDLVKVNQEDIFNFAVPKLIERYLTKRRLNN